MRPPDFGNRAGGEPDQAGPTFRVPQQDCHGPGLLCLQETRSDELCRNPSEGSRVLAVSARRPHLEESDSEF